MKNTMKIKESELHEMIKASVKKIVNEGNHMRNAEPNQLYSNCDKAMAHIKAAMNIWRKVGKQDEIRGRADSKWAIIMQHLKNAFDGVNAYSFESLEIEHMTEDKK